MNLQQLKQDLNKQKQEIKNLEKASMQTDIFKHPEKIKIISRKLKEKQKKVFVMEQLTAVYRQLSETKKLIKDEIHNGKDPELIKLAKDELILLQKHKQLLGTNLKSFGKPTQSKNLHTILEIRAGTGGKEASLFVQDLFRMYTQYTQDRGWKMTILNKNQTGQGGFKEITAQITGKDSYSKLKFESGVHRVQRVPLTERSGRIHTSAVSIVVYPLMPDEKLEIDPNDLKIDVYRSSGPGGQSVNTTDSAVRITHLPTGILITCQDEKSQHKNKKKALTVLSAKIIAYKKNKQQEKISEIRKTAIKTGDRSAKIRTYNFPQNRITDHRIHKSWHNLKAVLDGHLDQIIDTLTQSI